MVIINVSSHITENYKTHYIPWLSLYKWTKRYNYSSTIFTNGYRHKSKVKSLGNIVIYDFDDGKVSINEVAGFLFNNKITGAIFTTKSHQKEKGNKPACDRFRLLIPLSRQLKVSIDDYSLFYDFLAKILKIEDKIDKACKDPARMYYPNPNQEETYINTGYIFDAGVLEVSFKRYKAAKDNERKEQQANNIKQYRYNRQKSGKLAKNEVPADTEVELKGGELRLLKDFEYLQGDERVTCRCINPSHEDRHPSAFIGRANNKDNSLMITCRGCGQTYFMERRQ